MVSETAQVNATDGNGSPLTARDIMTPAPRTCSTFSTVTEAVLIFRDSDCGAVPVVEKGKPVGIVTDRDVALALGERDDLPERPVAEVMSRDVASVPPDMPVERLREQFGDAQVRRLVVVDGGGELQGIIAWSDLVGRVPDRQIGQIVSQVVGEPPAGGRNTVGAEPEKGAQPGAAIAPKPQQDQRERHGRWAWAHPGQFWGLLRAASKEWMEDKAPRLGAALAFYSALSLAPLVMLAISIAALIVHEQVARQALLDQIRALAGKAGAEAVELVLSNARRPRTGMVASLVSIAVLLVGASGVFGQLQDALNTVWEVQPKPGRGLLRMLQDRFLSFSMVLGTGFLLLVSLILSTALEGFLKFAGGMVPALAPVLQVSDLVVSFAVVALLFAMMFKFLPDVHIAWGDVWFGAVLTTALFLVGKVVIGLYLGRSSYATTYGAAGSLVVMLVWIYYSAQILLYGAELTKVYADRFGSRIVPARGAEPVTPEARAEQGLTTPDDHARPVAHNGRGAQGS